MPPAVRPTLLRASSASGSPSEVTAVMDQMAQALPSADVRPVRQIMEGEARVLGKTRATLLAAAALIILTAALCVLSTLMGWVFDRRRDFAIMKALGASERLLNGFFAAEAAVAALKAHLIKRGFGDIEVNVTGGYDPTSNAASAPLIQAQLTVLKRAATPMIAAACVVPSMPISSCGPSMCFIHSYGLTEHGPMIIAGR